MIPGEFVCEDYQIVRKVGEGSFGYVYKVKHRISHEYYALKTDEKSITKMELYNEVAVLQQIHKRLNQLQHSKSQKPQVSISKCLASYFAQLGPNKMLMPLLGQNIFNLFHKCNKRFDSETIYKVSKAMLKNIQFVHDLGFIHRDIKPQNFVVGKGGQRNDKHKDELDDEGLYLVDFGLAKEYMTKEGNKHVSYEIGRKIRGTPMYMSVNVMLGIEPSRRDDLESFMYIVVFLMKGRLPWHDLKITRKDFDELIMAKISIQPDQLFTNLPSELKNAFIYIRKLKFEQKPNYKRIMESLESILGYRNHKIEQEYDGKYCHYCWEVIYEKEHVEQLTENVFEYMQSNFLDHNSKETEYSLIN